MNISLFFMFLFLYFFSFADIGYSNGSATGKNDALLFNDPNKAIEITAGQQFRIGLDANPTTGYRWQLSEPLNKSIILFVGNDFQATPTDRVGAGGRQIFTFKAAAPGKTSIGLAYQRSWEKGVAPIKTVTFSVTIK